MTTASTGRPQPAAIGPLGWILIALRLALMLAWLSLCIVAYYVRRLFPGTNRWPPIFLGGVAWLAGVDVTIRGLRLRGGAFLLANHVSWIDIPAIAAASGAAFIAHDGLAAIPLLRWLCRMNGTVFVARHDRRSVADQVAQVRAAITDSGVLAIFPEGTTSDGTALLPFKSSLLSALDPVPDGIVIQPVWLDYGGEAAAIAWVGEEPGLDNFLRILARPSPVKLTVHLLRPLSGAALANRKALAIEARAAIIAAMGRQRVAL